MLIEFTVKGVKFSVDAAKLTPESITKAFNKAHSRVAAERWTGKQEKSLTLEQLQTEAKNFAVDPNQFWAKYGTRGEGVSRPKLDMCEKAARNYFKDVFMIHLKNNVPQVVAVWKANGGSGLLLKQADKMTADQLAVVNRNLAAKAKIIEKRTAVERKKAEKAGAKIDLDLGA